MNKNTEHGKCVRKTYDKAIALDVNLKALEMMVRVTIEYVGKGDKFNSTAYWMDILRPMATLHIGWRRGYSARSIGADDDGEYTKACSADEEFLRSQGVWEVVTQTWISWLDEVSTGEDGTYESSNGRCWECGCGR